MAIVQSQLFHKALLRPMGLFYLIRIAVHCFARLVSLERASFEVLVCCGRGMFHSKWGRFTCRINKDERDLFHVFWGRCLAP